MGVGRRQHLRQHTVPPARFDLGREDFRDPRVGGQRLRLPGQGPEPEPAEDQRRHPVRVGGCEHGRHEGPVGPARNTRPGGPGRVHDRDDVVDLLFQYWHTWHGVGHASAALVEHDHPAVAG
jgi:hypothetical protein